MGDAVLDGPLTLPAFDVHLGQLSLRRMLPGTDAGFLLRVELRVHDQPVLEVVDAQRRRLFESHSAQVPRDFQSMFVRMVRSGFQFLGRDVHVGLERGHAFCCPVVDEPRRIVRPGELVQLRPDRRRAFEIWAGQEQFWPRNFAFVDFLLHRDVRVGLQTSGRPRRRYASGKIQPWRGVRHFAVERQQAGSSIGQRIEEVLMHPDQSGEDRLAAHVQDFRAGWKQCPFT
jgi:hypothetical protein